MLDAQCVTSGALGAALRVYLLVCTQGQTGRAETRLRGKLTIRGAQTRVCAKCGGNIWWIIGTNEIKCEENVFKDEGASAQGFATISTLVRGFIAAITSRCNSFQG